MSWPIISELSFLGIPDIDPIKVGSYREGKQIKELVPLFNPDGALIAVNVIGSSGQQISIITTYGVVCSIKTMQ